LDPPAVTYGAFEYWHANESAYDDPSQRDPVTVIAGQKLSNLNFILNQTPPRFDQFEDGEVRLEFPTNPFVPFLLREPESPLAGRRWFSQGELGAGGFFAGRLWRDRSDHNSSTSATSIGNNYDQYQRYGSMHSNRSFQPRTSSAR